MLVVVLACGSIGGRLAVAFVSDALGARLARSWLLLPCALLMAGTLTLFALVQTQAMLYATATLVGAA